MTDNLKPDAGRREQHEPWCASVPREYDKAGSEPLACDCKPQVPHSGTFISKEDVAELHERVAERSPLPSPEAQPYDPKKHGYNKDWETDNVPDDMEDWDVERLRKLCSRLTEEQYVTVQISTLRKLLVERTSAVAPAEVPLPGKEKE